MTFWSNERDVMEYELNAKNQTKYLDMARFLHVDFEKVYNGEGPTEADGKGPVHGAGMRKTFSGMTRIFTETLRPCRFGDDFIPVTPRPPPRSARETEHRHIGHYSKIFPKGHIEPPPTGLWAACSKRIDNKQLIKKPPLSIVEKYNCKDPLGLNEIPVNFPPPVLTRRVKLVPSDIVASKEAQTKPVMVSGNLARPKPVFPSGLQAGTKTRAIPTGYQVCGSSISQPRTVPVIPSQNIGISQDPAMEDLREARGQKDPVQVEKRLSLAAKKLEFFAKRQHAGCDVWVFKGERFPETNSNKYWDANKNAFIAIKNTKVVPDRSCGKKRPREDDVSKSRKRQCNEARFYVQNLAPQPILPCISGCAMIPTKSMKRPREEDESVGRKKQCTTPFFMPHPSQQVIMQVPQTQIITTLPGIVTQPRQNSLQSYLNLLRQPFPSKNGVTTRMVPVPTPPGQISDLARFGFEYQINIRPLD